MDGKEILKEVLEITGNNINSLARALGKRRSQSLYDIESGKTEKISSELSEQITKAFPQINRDWLLTGEGERFKPEQKRSYLQQRLNMKISDDTEGIPIYDVPIDASFIERVRDNHYEPLYYLNIPRLRNCNFGAIVSGNSMYPVMKSGTIAICRIVDQFDYFDPGEMYFISTTNEFETVKYVQMAESPDELLLIPHNEKITPRTIRKDMIIRMCIVEAWLNFR